MSLWTKLRDKVVRPVLGAVANAYIPGSGALITTRKDNWTPATLPPSVRVRPGVGAVGQNNNFLPGLAGVAPVLIGGAAVVGRGAAALFRSANVYCRRHPAWCAAAGGLPAIAQMVGNGQLPPIKRARRKGISAGDLRQFRRVAGFLSKWGPVASKLPCRPRKSSRSC